MAVQWAGYLVHRTGMTEMSGYMCVWRKTGDTTTGSAAEENLLIKTNINLN